MSLEGRSKVPTRTTVHRDIKRDEHSYAVPTNGRRRGKERERESSKKTARGTAKEDTSEGVLHAGRAGRAPGIPDFQVRAESGEPRCPERRWSLWPMTPSIIAKSYTTYLGEARKPAHVLSRNGQGRAYSPPPLSSPSLVSSVHPRFPSAVKISVHSDFLQEDWFFFIDQTYVCKRARAHTSFVRKLSVRMDTST